MINLSPLQKRRDYTIFLLLMIILFAISWYSAYAASATSDQSQQTPDWIMPLVIGVSIIVSIIIFAVTSVRDLKWKKREFAFKLYESFDKDELINQAKFNMDYYTNANFEKILMIHYHHGGKYDCYCRNYEPNFTQEEVKMRQCFDRYFDFLSRLEYCLKKKIINDEELYYYAYWINKTKEDEILMHYAEGYYKSFKVLMDTYEKIKETFDEETKRVLNKTS